MNNESMAETIAQVTNLNILEMYRSQGEPFFAHRVDEMMCKLCKEIITALDLLPNTEKGTGDAAEAPAGESPSSAAGSPGKSEEPGVAAPDPAPTESVAKRESPATAAQDGPEKPGSNKKPEPAAGGAGEGKNESSPLVHGRAGRIRDRVGHFMIRNALNEHRAAEHFDISHPTLVAFLDGKSKPRKPTLKKIEKGLTRAPKVNRSVPPATLLKNRVDNWIEDEGVDIEAAANRLQLSEGCLDQILAGNLVHVNVIDQLRDKGVLTESEWCPIRNACKQQQSRAA